MRSSQEVDRMWCRALAEEIGERPDLINKIVTNYNKQRADGSWGDTLQALKDATAEVEGRRGINDKGD